MTSIDPPTMSTIPFDADDGETIRQQMQVVRHEIQEDAEQLAGSTRQLTQWREYVRAYPWLCLGGAAILGAAIAPSRSRRADPSPTERPRSYHNGGTMLSFIGATLGRAAIGMATQFAVDHISRQLEPEETPLPFEETFHE